MGEDRVILAALIRLITIPECDRRTDEITMPIERCIALAKTAAL